MGYYIYKHLNKKSEVIYIGLTIDINSRQSSHKSNSHWNKEIYKIEYAEVTDNMLMEIYEKYYIDKYLPKYNIKDMDCQYSRFFKNMEELDFKIYDKSKLYKKHKEKEEEITLPVHFDTYYMESLDLICKFREIFIKDGEIIDGIAYINNYLDCCFVFWNSYGFEAINMLQGGKIINKFGYNPKKQGLNMDNYNHLKSEEQLKYKSLDELWEEIFIQHSPTTVYS